MLQKLCLVSILLMAYATAGALAKEPKVSNGSSSSRSLSDKYKIKYLSSYTEYPVKLIDNHKKPGTKWHKYGCNCDIDQSDTLRKYFSTETDTQSGATNLLLINYDKVTNSLLDHYEPKHDSGDYTSVDYDEINPIIYTLAYLNDFELLVKDLNKDEAEITCKVRVLISKGLNIEHETSLVDQLENSIHVRLRVPDHHRFINRKNQNKEIVEKDHDKHEHHHGRNNKTNEFKAKSSSSFKRVKTVDHKFEVQNRTSRFVNTLNEMEIIEVTFLFN